MLLAAIVVMVTIGLIITGFVAFGVFLGLDRLVTILARGYQWLYSGGIR